MTLLHIAAACTEVRRQSDKLQAAFYTLFKYSLFVRQTSLVIPELQKEELRHAEAQLVEALRYKSEGRGFDSRLCHWNFSLT